MQFFVRKDIFNHKYICCFFFNNISIFFMINIYSDEHHSTLKYLKDTKVNLQIILIMADNFNIRSNNWDLLYIFHSIYSDTLLDIADFLTSAYFILFKRYLLNILIMPTTQIQSSIYSSYNLIPLSSIIISYSLSFDFPQIILH